jgi:short-subunit dehydrogenase
MKRIAVVGGGGGLGNAVVEQLLDRKYDVVVTGRTRPADRRIREFYPIDPIQADWQSLYQTMEAKAPAPLDGVVFVAGSAVFGRTTRIPLERARQTVELNFWACTSAAREAAEYWDARRRPGKFLAILSIVARRSVPFESYYAASKAATARFLECLQLEYAHKGIEFVCAYPGRLRTPFRRRAEWYGLEVNSADDGADVNATARAVVNLLAGNRKTRIIGWRERSIDFADRISPGLYDYAVLQKRIRKLLKE